MMQNSDPEGKIFLSAANSHGLIFFSCIYFGSECFVCFKMMSTRDIVYKFAVNFAT